MPLPTIQPGHQLPDFDGRTLGGQPVNYRRDAWQKKLVVLVTFASPDSPGALAYRAALAAREPDLTACETMLLLRDRTDPAGAARAIPIPSVVIADRWGEVRAVEQPADDRGLPPVDEILEWLRFVQAECPECQGETK